MVYKNGVVLGCRAKDSITGFEGIVVAATEWLNGCQRITIQPTELREGKPVDSLTFEVEQLEVITPAVEPVRDSTTGGPPIQPTRAVDPGR